jgi:hypothetical protein
MSACENSLWKFKQQKIDFFLLLEQGRRKVAFIAMVFVKPLNSRMNFPSTPSDTWEPEHKNNVYVPTRMFKNLFFRCFSSSLFVVLFRVEQEKNGIEEEEKNDAIHEKSRERGEISIANVADKVNKF